MINEKISTKIPMFVVTFQQDFKSTRDSGGIYEVAAMLLSKQYLTGPAKSAVESHIALPNSVSTGHAGTLQASSNVGHFLFKTI